MTGPSTDGKTRPACDMEGCLKPREEETPEGLMCEMHARKLRSVYTETDR